MKSLQDNLEVIRMRWPHVADALSEAPAVRAELVHDGPEPTLLADGIHLSSSYDRKKEADLQASLVPNEATEAWVYGIGLGDLPRLLLGRPRLRRLNVVLFNPSVALQNFGFFPHLDWLRDERVNLLTAARQERVCFPFAAVPSCLQLADDASMRLRDLVVLELATPFIRKRHAADNMELLTRLRENEPYVAADGSVAELFGCYPGATILVAGAGPTLSESFNRLRSRKTPLIAVDAALKSLTAAGIIPDIVTTIDGNAEVIGRFFRESNLVGCENVQLIYFPTVHHRVLDMWPGPRFAAYSSAPLFQDLKAHHPRAELFSAGSVIHPAVDLAVRMGAAQVVLLGADFSYPGGRSHVAGCITGRKVELGTACPYVMDWKGNRIATAANLRGYLRDLESYIARQSQVNFFCGSVRGARIHGACLWEEGNVF